MHTRPRADLAMKQDEEFRSRLHPVKENLAYQQAAWLFERLGLLALMILIALTLAGLFSKGPLSEAQARTDDGHLTVEYERFNRNGAQEDLVISAIGKPGELVNVVLGNGLFEGFSVEALNPQPAPLRSQDRDLLVPMRLDETGHASLYLTLRSNGVGLYRAHIYLQGGQRLEIWKFIYP